MAVEPLAREGASVARKEDAERDRDIKKTVDVGRVPAILSTCATAVARAHPQV